MRASVEHKNGPNSGPRASPRVHIQLKMILPCPQRFSHIQRDLILPLRSVLEWSCLWNAMNVAKHLQRPKMQCLALVRT